MLPGRDLLLILIAILTMTCAEDVNRRQSAAQDVDGSHSIYALAVMRDTPVAWWRMSPGEDRRNDSQWQVASTTSQAALVAQPAGNVKPHHAGPFGKAYPDFADNNLAIWFGGRQAYLRVKDPGPDSAFDFRNGDAITIEAWVKPQHAAGSGHAYLVGKGRTHNSGFSRRNQNYSLRLAYEDGKARLSFFFVDSETTDGVSKADGHRWISTNAFALDNRWHYVAVTYTFGEPSSMRGYIDGLATAGDWDLGGPTRKQPVVDDDELWIGASMGGSAGFLGLIDEVAIYRRTLTADALARHANINRQAEAEATMEIVRAAAVDAAVPETHVQVDVYEGIADAPNWNLETADGRRLDTSSSLRKAVYETDVFALTELPRKYNDRALILDRRTPLLVHAYTRLTMPVGRHQLLLRSLNGARLYVDDELLAQTPFLELASNGHGTVEPIPPTPPGMLSLPAMHHEEIAYWESDGQPHVFSLVAVAGHAGRPAELGELVVAVSDEAGKFQLLGVEERHDLHRLGQDFGMLFNPDEFDDGFRARQVSYGRFDDAGWWAFLERDFYRRRVWETRRRRQQDQAERAYWTQRHAWAKQVIEATPPVELPEVEHPEFVNNEVDRFIQHRLEVAEIEPTRLVDDAAFLRRLALEVTGVIPSAEEQMRFQQDPPAQRRQRAIDRLLADPGWADHWVSYWQAVLAENPGVIKPSLNNSGPFRWFLHEAFMDNKPFDRIIWELVHMEGGQRSGGPAGFGVAANNDMPMAAKAHILGTALLGTEMKCARCHDAPFHDSTQQDLFQLASMLARKPLAVPASSTVPATAEQLAHMAVTVSLKPGVPVDPLWPFAELAPASFEDVPDNLVRQANDPRGQLAWRLTHPLNRRAAEVIVNRLWQRYLGRGLVEPVHDWEGGSCSHPELLKYLSDEFVRHGYDLQRLARLILNSQTYQRAVDQSHDDRRQREALFGSPSRRRMTAEQLVDSMMAACGKNFDTEELTLNPDGRQVAKNFLNLGVPRRAWQFAGTTNERERPSTTLPRAQAVIDLMMAYGWQQNRQEPVNERETDVTPLTPLLLANGTASARAMDLSDNGELVQLCLDEQTVEGLVQRIFVRFLSRKPRPHEIKLYVELLGEGFETRCTAADKADPQVDRSPLSWSNNLNIEANRIGRERQRLALEGDKPSRRLTADWRERMEDMIWVLINSPEFIYLP